jgi:beta-xylosidase
MDSSDRIVSRYTQDHQIIILTANQNMKGEDSLEQVMREENTETSLPIVTMNAPPEHPDYELTVGTIRSL